MASSTHKAELIGLHLIQASRNTVTVSGWHNGFEDFVGTSGSLHNGCLSQWELWQSLQGIGSACFESMTGLMLCISEEAETDMFKGWRIVLYSCHLCGPLHMFVFALLTGRFYCMFCMLYS